VTGRRSALTRATTLLVGWGLALQAFGAIYRPEALGFLAASPGVLFLLVAALLALPQALVDGITLRGWLLLGWGVVASLVSAMLFGWNSLYASKVTPLLILSMVWMAPLLCLQAMDIKMLKISLGAGLALTGTGYVLGDLFPTALPGTVREFIFGGGYEVYVDSRPRAFMTETSHFAAILGRYAILLFMLFEIGRRPSQIRLIVGILSIAVGLLVTESKGAAVSMAVTLLALSVGRHTIRWSVFLVPAVWWIVDTQIGQIAFDIANFTSTSTRTGLLVAALAATLVNPLGWGYYGFYGTVERFGNWSMDVLSDLPLLFIEMQTIVGDLTSVSYKSTLLDFSVVFGFAFWFFIAGVIQRVDTNDPRVRCVLVYLVFTSFSTGSHESISFFLGLAILARYFPKSGFPVLKNNY
jgi:hypothetical protein